MFTEKSSSNEKRLETMRKNLSNIENKVESILSKDALTYNDKMILLSCVNVSFHTSGKIESIFSIDSCAACDFCQKMIKNASCNPLIICGLCYAAADAWKEAAWRRHKINARIFSSVLFSTEELKTLNLHTALLVRFNEDGDTVNETMSRNYLRITAAFPRADYGYYFKNYPEVEKGLIAEGYTSREKLPKNVRFIQSSVLIGFPSKPVWFADAVFTVYPDAETIKNAILNGSIECNGKKCMVCGFHCYLRNRQSTAVNIAEYLRCNKAAREKIMVAYRNRIAEISK